MTQKYYFDSSSHAQKKTQFESENSTVYSLDANYNVTTITYPDNTTESNTYNTNGMVLTSTDKAGKVTTYVYGNSNNPDRATLITEPFNGSITKETTNIYDTAGNLTGTFVTGTGQETYYTYNSHGLKVAQAVIITDGSNTYTTETGYDYDALGRLSVTTIVGETSNSYISQEYDAYGNISYTTDAKDVVTGYSYNMLGQLIQKSFDDGTALYFSYDNLGKKTTEVDAKGKSTTYKYDSLGRQVRVSYADATNERTVYTVNSDGTQVQTKYDAEGDKSITVTDKKGQTTLTGTVKGTTDTSNETTTGNQKTYGGSVLIEYTQTTYDLMGNATQTTDNTGVTTTNTYDNLGQVTQAVTNNGSLSTTTSYTYDDAGNTLTEVTPTATTTTSYDKLNRPLAVTTSKNGSSSTTSYAYDGVYNGKLQTVMTDPLNRETTYSYNVKGQIASETLVNANQTRTTAYTYDGNGNMLTSTLTDSRYPNQSAVTSYTYDVMNRKTQVTYKQGDEYVNYTYDNNGNVTLEELYEDNVKTSSTAYQYDTMNRVTKITRDNVVVAIYTYTADGSVASIQYGDSATARKIGYAYDDAGKITAVNELTGDGSATIRTYTYKDGVLDYLVDARGTDDAKQTFAYDTLKRLTNVKYYDTDDVTVLEEYAITYKSELGNTKDQIATENTITHYGGTRIETDKTYNYDDLSRLSQEIVSVTVNNGTPTTTTTSYTYDAVGNRTSMVSGGTTQYYHYNAFDQLLSTDTDNDTNTTSDTLASYTYDLSGNQVTMTEGDVVTTYAYDDANWLQSVSRQDGQDPVSTIATFNYDASGQRTQKAVGSSVTNYFYSGTELLYTKDGNGSIIEQNVLEPDGSMIKSRRANGNDYWYRQDIRGSVTNIVDVADAVVKSYTYDAYGKTSSTGTFINSFAYTSAVIDPETGLYYMNARYYDPETGRFISQDTYRGDGESFWHLYLYCDGNPVNYTDPTGHKIKTTKKSIFRYQEFLKGSHATTSGTVTAKLNITNISKNLVGWSVDINAKIKYHIAPADYSCAWIIGGAIMAALGSIVGTAITPVAGSIIGGLVGGIIGAIVIYIPANADGSMDGTKKQHFYYKKGTI